MPEMEKDKSLDYSLTLNALYTALYSKENLYVDSKESAFVLSKKPSSKFRDRLLEKVEDKKIPLFASPSDYSTILSTYYSGKRRRTSSSNSSSHRTFLVTHLGGSDNVFRFRHCFF